MKYDFTKIRLIFLVAFIGIIGCSGDFDFDMRDQLGGRLDTSSAANSAVANRPDPDERGVITFPNYQVVVARNGDKIGDLAERISADPQKFWEVTTESHKKPFYATARLLRCHQASWRVMPLVNL